MKRFMLLNRVLLVMLAMMFLNSTAARTEHFEATIPEGTWLEVWTKNITAENLKDKDGDSVEIGGRDFDLNVNLVMLRPIYVTKYWIFDAWIPFVDQEISALDVDDSGIGDIWVSAWVRNENASEKWRPFDINISPGIEMKIPTNTDVSDEQYDLRADLRFSRFFFTGSPFGEGYKFAIEGALDYTYRFENPDTDIKPGDEFHWVIGPSIAVGNAARLGMDVGGTYVRDQEYDGDKMTGTWSRSWYVGPTVCYALSQQVQIRAKASFDIDARNCSKNRSVYLRLVYYHPPKK